MHDYTDEELDQLASEAVEKFGEDGAIERLALASGYKKMPPTIDEVIDNDYYAGKFLGPNSPTPLYEFYRELLRDVYPHPLHARYKEVMLTGPIGGGKGLTLNTKVITPNFGLVPISEIKVGDLVSNPDGGASRVMGVYPQGKKQIYKITFHDESTVRCDSSHLWLFWETVKESKGDKHYIHDGEPCQKMRVVSTVELLERNTAMKKQKKKLGGSFSNMCIPVSEPVRFSGNTMEPTIDPYLVGLYLGDGCSTGYEFNVTSADEETQQYLLSLGWHVRGLDRSAPTYYPTGDIAKKFKGRIKAWKLLHHHCAEKFIPLHFFRSPIEQRWALLQGLMDSDGSVDERGHLEYTTTSEVLAKGVQNLVESLGGWASIGTKIGSYRKNGVVIKCKKVYRLYIQIKNKHQVFRLPRKIQRTSEYNNGREGYRLARRIISIEEDGVEDTVCIRVDHPNGLFLLERYVVTHNSTVCLTGMFYDLLRILHLEDPHKTFHVGFADQLVLAFLNTTKSQAQSKQYRQFISWILASPFMQEQLIGIKTNVHGDETPILPHNIVVIPGSRAGMFLGGAVMMALLSELNFQGETHKDQAVSLFETIDRRMDSRFEKGEGGLQPPGRLWLDSSKSDESGFLERHISEVASRKDVIVVNKPVWEIVPPWKRKYSEERFLVFQGNDSMEPVMLRSEEEALNYPASDILRVPMDFYDKFNQDIYGGLRDVAGVSTWRTHKFIPQVHLISKALCLPNLALKSVIHIDFDNPGRIVDQIPNIDKLVKGAQYFVHWDIATKGDRAGFAMTRPTGPVVVTKVSQDFSSDLATEMSFQTDLAIAISPVPGKVIPITVMKNLIIDLRNMGYTITGASADGHQSENLLQDLTRLKFNTKVISTVRNRYAYDLMRDCIVEQRWRGPLHPILENELKGLMDLGDEVDHPSKGSKDIADAVAGSLFHANQKGTVSSIPTAIRQHTERKKEAQPMQDPVMMELLRAAGKTMADLNRQPKTTAAERKAIRDAKPLDEVAEKFRNAWDDRRPEKP